MAWHRAIPARLPRAPSAAGAMATAVAVVTVAMLGVGQGPCVVWAQSPQVLIGQGIDPVTAGYINYSVPVYVSISLEKLVEIDEIGYTFSALFTVITTWRDDPRINATVNLVNFIGSDLQAVQKQQLDNCTKWAALTGATNNPDCISALSKFGGNCERICFMGKGSACCDNLWIPGFNLNNILYQSQDRVLSDQVWLYGSSVGGLNSDWGAVYRVTRVHGTFSNKFDFEKFPFDSQKLKLQMAPIPPANHHIAPSILGLSVLGQFGFVFQYDGRAFAASTARTQSGSSRFDNNVVTGWSFIGNDSQTMTMCCDSSCPVNPHAPSTSTGLPNNLNPDDPQAYAYKTLFLNQSLAGPQQQGLTCSICIFVTRNSRYYIANDIIPVLVNSLLSFTVVFARPTDLDIRLSTLVTLFLALVAVQFVIADQLPRTEYMTAFMYLVLCSYCLIVVLILESLFVFYLSVLEENYERKQKAMEMKKSRRSVTKRLRSTPEMNLTEGQDGTEILAERASDLTPTDPDENQDYGNPPARSPMSLPRVRTSKSSRFVYRPFMYTEERLLAFFQGGDDAFRIASMVDNISLALLGIGYIIGAVLCFVLTQSTPRECYL